MIKATSKDTKDYIQSHNLFPKSLGSTNLFVSELGFGSYRVNLNSIDHKDALVKALKSGINLIDTSSNYADGDAERLIGNTLHELYEDNVLRRENIVLVSKVGYVQGKVLQHANMLKEKQKGYEDYVEIDQSLAHCIHPEFLNDQLEECLDRLQTTCIYCIILNILNYFLSEMVKRKKKQIPFIMNVFKRHLLFLRRQ